jgi:hypothetical protein
MATFVLGMAAGMPGGLGGMFGGGGGGGTWPADQVDAGAYNTPNPNTVAPSSSGYGPQPLPYTGPFPYPSGSTTIPTKYGAWDVTNMYDPKLKGFEEFMKNNYGPQVENRSTTPLPHPNSMPKFKNFGDMDFSKALEEARKLGLPVFGSNKGSWGLYNTLTPDELKNLTPEQKAYYEALYNYIVFNNQ